MSRPKQQHYVMRAYLGQFLPTGESLLWCYGRKRDKPFRSQPEDLAKQRNYYTILKPDGSLDDALEHLFNAASKTPV